MTAHRVQGPIGVFDSGVGGLTVLKALLRRLPHESTVYLGDTARVPYGTKSAEVVTRYSVKNAEFLLSRGVKVLVVACNTASAVALPALRARLSIPVIGVIEPGAQAAAMRTKTGHIGVIGTPGTIRSGAYQRALADARSGLTVQVQTCPLFVPLAEEGWLEGDVPRLIAREYLSRFRREDTEVGRVDAAPPGRSSGAERRGDAGEAGDPGRSSGALEPGRPGDARDSGRSGGARDSGRSGGARDSGRSGGARDSGRSGGARDSGRSGGAHGLSRGAIDIDTLVLGCTHYPLLTDVIAEAVGPGVILVDSAEATAEAVAELLTRTGALSDEARDGEHAFFTTDAPDRFVEVGARFLGQPIHSAEQLDLHHV